MKSFIFVVTSTQTIPTATLIPHLHSHTLRFTLVRYSGSSHSEIPHWLVGFLSHWCFFFSLWDTEWVSVDLSHCMFFFFFFNWPTLSNTNPTKLTFHCTAFVLCVSTEKRQDNGRVYFVNHNTRTTQWDDPRTQGWDCELEKVQMRVCARACAC